MDDVGVTRLAGGSTRMVESFYSKKIQATAIYATLALLVLDILSPPGEPLTTLIGALVYGGKTALSIMIVFLGIYALIRTRLPILFRISLVLYISIVMTWFCIWLMGARNAHSSNSSLITYLFNPTYSIWAWLFILLIPLAAQWNANGQIICALRRIPLTLGLFLMLLPSIGIGLFQWNVNASNPAVFMLLLLALRPPTNRAVRIGHFVLTVVVCAAMLFAGYRIYAMGALLFGLNLYVPKRKRLLIAQIFFISVLPIIYSLIISSYSSFVLGQDNSLLKDTRSFLYTELVDDFSIPELWVGRGFDASYYSPYFRYVARHFSSDVGFNNIWRTTSEIGWLNVILHFGIQALVPFYVALISPIIASSRERCSKYSIDGIYCFIPVMALLFAGELWSAVNISYFCWYIALGALLTNRLPSLSGHPQKPMEFWRRR